MRLRRKKKKPTTAAAFSNILKQEWPTDEIRATINRQLYGQEASIPMKRAPHWWKRKYIKIHRKIGHHKGEWIYNAPVDSSYYDCHECGQPVKYEGQPEFWSRYCSICSFYEQRKTRPYSRPTVHP